MANVGHLSIFSSCFFTLSMCLLCLKSFSYYSCNSDSDPELSVGENKIQICVCEFRVLMDGDESIH